MQPTLALYQFKDALKNETVGAIWKKEMIMSPESTKFEDILGIKPAQTNSATPLTQSASRIPVSNPAT